MEASARRLVSKLERGSQSSAAATKFRRLLVRSDPDDQIAGAKHALDALLESPSALSNLLDLVASGDANSSYVMASMMPYNPLPYDPPQKPFAVAVASSTQAQAIIKQTIAALASGDFAQDWRSCRTLYSLASEPVMANVRLAAAEGAIDKLVQVLERWAPSAAASSSLSPTATAKVAAVTAAIYALNNVAQGSDNRCKAAVKAGALKPLAKLLAPGTADSARGAALSAVHNILRLENQLPFDRPLAELLVAGLVDLVCNSIPSARSVAVNILHFIAALPGDDYGQLWWRVTKAAALIKAKAAAALVEDARSNSLHNAFGALQLLTSMLQANGLPGTPNSRVQLATEVVDAGGIELLRKAADEQAVRAAAAAADDGMQGKFMWTVMAAATVMGYLAKAGPQFAMLIGVEQLRALPGLSESTRAATTEQLKEIEQRSSSCAKCGAREGSGSSSGPAVKLQVCSRCKKVKYCSVGCQREHWRVHKRGCCSAGTEVLLGPRPSSAQ